MGLMPAGNLSWVLMVAPKLASVAFSLSLIKPENWDMAATLTIEHNSRSDVKAWAWLVDNMSLGNAG